jgi:hypothetical protein
MKRFIVLFAKLFCIACTLLFLAAFRLQEVKIDQTRDRHESHFWRAIWPGRDADFSPAEPASYTTWTYDAFYPLGLSRERRVSGSRGEAVP